MYYFAYGSCMNFGDFARTQEVFEFIDTAILYDHRLAFTKYSPMRKGGVADIVVDPYSRVEGILYRVNDFESLDIREGVPFSYIRIPVVVQRQSNGTWVEAQTYEVTRKSFYEFAPSEHYARLIREGASKLSPRYREKLNFFLDSFEVRGRFGSLDTREGVPSNFYLD